ncbi:MAG: hypothetical protein PHS10_02920 [Thiovulaceae bacterium]|nr:hypothetical protein [Sulfurimonadaceae bacterium]
MKKIILASGEIILNAFVIAFIIFAIISVIPMFQYGQALLGTLTLIAYLGAVTITTFLIYLLIDIRDKIAENNTLVRYQIQNPPKQMCHFSNSLDSIAKNEAPNNTDVR